MATVSILRIKPCDLQEVQIQANVGNNGLLTNVIQSLQFNRNATLTDGHTLNTACPTCAINGASKGFVSASYKGRTYMVPCPTCAGYLKYYTQAGALQPPTNPFNAPIVVKRLLPADIVQIVDGFVDITTLSGAITALQGNLDTPPTNNCPVCTHTGWITVNNNEVFCWLCQGIQKTVGLYTYDNGNLVHVVVPPVLPDPLIAPPVPDGSIVVRLPKE